MRLLVQEYLAMLKEDQELDQLIQDLATAIDLEVLYRPQKGGRQYGVDIHAVGTDPEDGVRKNFLITIKRGNIDRAAWDTRPQSVRQSINEILDAYIPKLGARERALPKKIVVCCGGELKQELSDIWSGFTIANTKNDITFALWHGGYVASLVEKHLLTENVFFEEVRRGMRRTLVMLSDAAYDLEHYKALLQKLFFNKEWAALSGKSLENRAVKTLSALPVCLGMIFHYSAENGSLKQPLFAAEHTLLRCWDFISRNNLTDNKQVIERYYQLLPMYFSFGAAYFGKLQAYCHLKDGITRCCGSSITASQVVFEQIGIISSLGLVEFFHGFATDDPNRIDNAKVASDALSAIIKNNGIAGSPIHDGMTIDICLAIFLLTLTGKGEDLKEWMFELIHRFHFSYAILDRHFPIIASSIETLIDFEYGKKHPKTEMASMSTLVPTLAYWCAIHGFDEQYRRLLDLVEKELKETCLQLWYPTAGIKKIFFSGYAGYEGGVAEAPIYLPKTLDELKARLKMLVEHTKQCGQFETSWNDSIPGLPLIASRHFRTPVIPFMWLSLLGLSEGPVEKEIPRNS